MEGVDAFQLTRHLKTAVSPAKHREIEELYLSYVSDPRPSNQQHVVRELQNLVGPEKLHEAFEASLVSPLPMAPGGHDHGALKAELHSMGGAGTHDREDASEYEADESESEAISKNTKGGRASSNSNNIEICESTLQAWNHCVECKKGPGCKVHLCAVLRPYVVHLRQKRSEGVVGVCLESCKFCSFFDNLKRRVVPHEEQMSTRKRKEAAKAKRLVQQFTGLLLAHSSERGDPIIRSLYEHVMQCLEEHCNFRVDYGSCRSSRALMFHLQECRADQTKTCELCSKLPPHVWRMKKKRRSLPKPAYVVKCIEEERKTRQRERRRQRSTNKRTGTSIGDTDEPIVGPDAQSFTADSSANGIRAHYPPSSLQGSHPDSPALASPNDAGLAHPSGAPRAYHPDSSARHVDGPEGPMSSGGYGAPHAGPYYADHAFSHGEAAAASRHHANGNANGMTDEDMSAPLLHGDMGMADAYRRPNSDAMSGDISRLSLGDSDLTPLGKRKPDELYLPGHFDKRGRSDYTL